MMVEEGVVVTVEPTRLWVQTQQRSTCGQCAARKGCGTGLLGDRLGQKMTRFSVARPDDAVDYQPGMAVRVGIDDQVVVRSALLVYLLPMLALMGSVALAAGLGLGELGSVLIGGLSLWLSALGIRHYLRQQEHCQEWQPILLGLSSAATVPIAIEHA